MFLESLEGRALMAVMPYGAMPDDTGEYMLGEVAVSVVLMESNASMSPHDTNQEDWTASSIAAIKSKVEEGVNWWKQTMATEFPLAPANLLNFTFDYTFADSPVQTGYEPINNRSEVFEQWIQDFFNASGYNQSASFNTNIRAFNHAQRINHATNWAFTIFVVNDAHDNGGTFASGGDFPQAFAYAGGQFLVVPASRPAQTIAHETGHMFWGLDEYLGISNNYLQRRGYYRVQNLNAGDNPDPDYVSEPSIMSNGTSMTTAFTTNTSSDSTLAMIGWRDSDSDGIFDVLDVPFTLQGTGRYDADHAEYQFRGQSSVSVLPNLNLSGLGNDITINMIREVQYSIDGADWQSIDVSDEYKSSLDLAIPMAPTAQQIRVRTIDTVTGVTSPEFVGTVSGGPSISSPSGIQGFVWQDSNFNGEFDANELPLSDFPVKLVDAQGKLVVMRRFVDGDDYALNTTLGQVHSEARMSAIAGRYRSDIANSDVVAITGGGQYAGQVFGVNSRSVGLVDTWSMDSRRLKIDFTTPVSRVGLQAYGASGIGIGRLEAYNASGQIVGRYTTNPLSYGNSEYMSIERPSADIAYIVAGGHQSTLVALDSLDWGANGSTTTASDGSYRLPSLPAGNYFVKVDVPTFQLSTTQIGGIGQATVASTAQTVSFGIGQLPNPWHNTLRPFDVDDTGGTDAADILYVLQFFTAHPDGESLPSTGPSSSLYVDVDNDGIVSPQDVLWLVYAISTQAQSGGTPTLPNGESGGQGVPGGGSSPADGESTPYFFPSIESDFETHEHHDEEVEAHSADPVNPAVSVAGFFGSTTEEKDSSIATTTTVTEQQFIDSESSELLNAPLPFAKIETEDGESSDDDEAAADDALLALLDEPLV